MNNASEITTAHAALLAHHPLLCEVAGDRFDASGFRGVYGAMAIKTLDGKELENALAVGALMLKVFVDHFDKTVDWNIVGEDAVERANKMVVASCELRAAFADLREEAGK